MNKVLIEIISPVTAKHYEFWIPKNMVVSDAVWKVAEEIMEYEGNTQMFAKEDMPFLYSGREKIIMNKDFTIAEAGIKSGNIYMIL